MKLHSPVIGCTTYRKRVPQARPIDVYGLMPSYTEAISAAGGIPVLIPMGLSEDDLEILAARLDGIVLPGGGDVDPAFYRGHKNGKVNGIDRERDRTELFMARTALSSDKPLLAICRGLQVLNVALGGTLWEDISSQVPEAINHDSPESLPRNHLAHAVNIERNSLLAQHFPDQQGWVNSIHHQAIRDLAPELQVNALAPDGIIEGVEVAEHRFALGVQWHPESLIHKDQAMLSLFQGLIRASANGHTSK